MFIVDDDPRVRDALQELLSYVGFRVASYADPEAFLDAYDPHRPGCLVLDIRMPIMSGLRLLERLPLPQLPVIVLTGHADVSMVADAFKLGAIEFLEKPVDDETLVNAVRHALVADTARRQRDARRQTIEQRLAQLTERERQILDRLVAGQAYKVIAAELGLGLSTVESHRKHIMEKLQARDRAALVRMVLSCRESSS